MFGIPHFYCSSWTSCICLSGLRIQKSPDTPVGALSRKSCPSQKHIRLPVPTMNRAEIWWLVSYWNFTSKFLSKFHKFHSKIQKYTECIILQTPDFFHFLLAHWLNHIVDTLELAEAGDNGKLQMVAYASVSTSKYGQPFSCHKPRDNFEKL